MKISFTAKMSSNRILKQFFPSLSLTTAVNNPLVIQVHQSTTEVSSWQPHSVPASRMVSLASGQEKRAGIISVGSIRAVFIAGRV